MLEQVELHARQITPILTAATVGLAISSQLVTAMGGRLRVEAAALSAALEKALARSDAPA